MSRWGKRLRQADRIFSTRSSLFVWMCDRLLDRLGAKTGLKLPRVPLTVKTRCFRHRILVRPGTTDLLVLEELVRNSEYDAVDGLLPEEASVIVDLGANIGLSACLWANRYANARIVAVEPDHDNAELCRRNLNAVGGRHTVVNAFVGGEDGWAGIDRSSGEWAYRMAPPSNNGERIPVLSMRTLLDRYVGVNTTVDLLKIDIEGAEAHLFACASDWLPRCRAVFAELHHDYYSLANLEADLRSAELKDRYDVRVTSAKGATTVVLIVRTGK